MPVTAGHVPGLTSGLRRVPMDPGRYHSGRWFVLAEGALVGAFGVAGLIAGLFHPHADPTGVPVFGLALTPAHSAMLLAFGAIAVAAVGNRRAAITVTGASAVAYLMLLFFSSVATARGHPTPLGFHAADIVLHGVLAVVNLGLLMWLIPDELGDEAWAPRRRRARERDRPPDSRPERESGQPSRPDPPAPPVTVHTARHARLDGSRGETSDESFAHATIRRNDEPRSRRVLVGAVAVLIVAVGVVIWLRRR